MNRDEKKQFVAELKGNLAKAASVVFIDYGGLRTDALDNLRREITQLGGALQVAKNTLIQLAIDEDMDLEGQTALVFAFGDPISPIKRLAEFDQETKATWIKGGIFEGQLLSAQRVLELSQIPGRDVLLAKFAGNLTAPWRQFLVTMVTPTNSFTSTLRELIKQKEVTKGGVENGEK